MVPYWTWPENWSCYFAFHPCRWSAYESFRSNLEMERAIYFLTVHHVNADKPFGTGAPRMYKIVRDEYTYVLRIDRTTRSDEGAYVSWKQGSFSFVATLSNLGLPLTSAGWLTTGLFRWSAGPRCTTVDGHARSCLKHVVKTALNCRQFEKSESSSSDS